MLEKMALSDRYVATSIFRRRSSARFGMRTVRPPSLRGCLRLSGLEFAPQREGATAGARAQVRIRYHRLA